MMKSSETAAKIPSFIDQWRNYSLSTERCDRELAKAGIAKAYAEAGLDTPEIIWTKSPMENAFRFLEQKHIYGNAKPITDAIFSAVAARVEINTTAEVKRGGYGNTANRETRATESFLEQHVSDIIGAMPFFWLAIDDEPGAQNRRGIIERNSIALLSNYNREPIDPPTRDWLGHHCSRQRVRESGLWNSNHVDEDYDPAFLDILENLARN